MIETHDIDMTLYSFDATTKATVTVDYGHGGTEALVEAHGTWLHAELMADLRLHS